MKKQELYWQDSLGQHFFDFLNNGKGFSTEENEMLDMVYLSSNLSDNLFISLIDSLKGRPEFLDEYFFMVLETDNSNRQFNKGVYQIVYENSDFRSVGKYLYHYSIVAKYALNFFGDGYDGYLETIHSL